MLQSSDDEAVTDSQTAELVGMMVLCTMVAAAVVGFLAFHGGRSSTAAVTEYD